MIEELRRAARSTGGTTRSGICTTSCRASSHMPTCTEIAPQLPRYSSTQLAVLARPASEYRSYVERVRAEYAEIPDDLWRVGRAAVLEAFLGRDTTYFTQPGRALEAAARRNLRLELDELAGETTP